MAFGHIHGSQQKLIIPESDGVLGPHSKIPLPMY